VFAGAGVFLYHNLDHVAWTPLMKGISIIVLIY
jgi:hypothetical protein